MEEVRFCHRCGASLQVELVDGHRRPRCPSCRLVVFLDPKLVTSALVPQGDDLLFVRRNIEPGRGLWALPGGYVELGERVEETVAREVQEETGLIVQVEGLVGLYSDPASAVVLAAYAVKPTSGKLAGDSREVQEVAFFSPDALPSLAFPRDRLIIDDWLRWQQRVLLRS